MTAAIAPQEFRILLVEDEPVIALTAEDMIEELGYALAAHAATVEEALDHVARTGFDLALLDINLNGKMSTPVAEALCAANKPFIFTTGYGSNGAHRAFDHIRVVTKPYTIATLGQAIADLARRD